MATLTAQAPQSIKVCVEPVSCLHDEPTVISMEGLSAGEEVTLQTSMTDTRGVFFFAFAHYRADDDGRVDVSSDASLGGSYEGVFPMGLVATLSPALTKYRFTRFFKKDVQNPNVVTISAFRGHRSKEELLAEDRGEPISTIVHLRHYMAPGVQRIPVRHGNIRGSLFLPPGNGPFPGVVDMFGSAGGLLEYRSAQLASRGFASLALAFFAYEDLPPRLEEFHISYFEEAVDFLLQHDKVMKSGIGTIGVSKGGDLALSMSTFIPKVKAAVCINGCLSNVQAALQLHDSTIPGLDFDVSRVTMVDDALDCIESLHDPNDFPETIIPIEKADANFLFLVSCDDKNWKSEFYADMAVERLRLAGKDNYEVHKYPESGHLLEPPFSPFCFASYHKLVAHNFMWGGTAQPHSVAQVSAWDTTLAFLRKHLQDGTALKGKL